MRRFHSYGPVNSKVHFCVERNELVEQCMNQLLGETEEGGHYFTIWAPRQTGKTWLMRQVRKRIEKEYKDRFVLGSMSMQGVVLEEEEPENALLKWTPHLVRDTFGLKMDTPQDWKEWIDIFHEKEGLFDRPVILFIDEFDSLPPHVIDRLVTLFRDMYLKRETYLLHGLALIGVRAVLGIASDRGSPFNIQRSLHVPNLTPEEVEELFWQYEKESGQVVEPRVVESVYESTRGQPGLVSWFGELVTEKFNPGKEKPIDVSVWDRVYRRACTTEWNNTVLNLIKKARGPYRHHVLELFGRSDLSFTLRADWCNYLYLNGIIDFETGMERSGAEIDICRFSCPFVQQCIYDALAYDLVGDRTPILALEPLDDLSDVFDGPELDLPALLQRYKDYLVRLRAKGLNPWKEQPRRADLHLTEAVGHFHLYAWLQSAVGRRCVVSPEFPTGNGKVDLHLRSGEKQGIIEVKSFVDASEAKRARGQAADYARSLGLDGVTLALFVPVEDEDVIEKLSGEQVIDGVRVTVVAIAWT
ncbi:MAG: AAA-like domain-containing protein [Deltaproteobacteria bacterium]|nr:AAA-like domain-containing protein [Deltaproteobacteria bacterium]MBW2331713.1 AAA-like domain-containing protein [Deltaproteobacteria bacterium]